MTIIEAINAVDALKPNTYTQSEKIRWLSTLDGLIYREIIQTHTDTENVEFDGYTDDTPVDTVLLVESPYDELYIAWLESKIDYSNAEYSKYNNSITRFNDAYSAFSKYYNRTNTPKTQKVKYF